MVLSTAPDAKLVAVVGATGSQGGSVVNHLIASDRPYRIRALTRDTATAAAQALAARGVEVVKADASDPPSLAAAFAGADIVFGMTTPQSLFDKGEGETKHGIAIVDAARAAKVSLLVWAGLPAVAELSGGRYPDASIFDAKAAVTAHARAAGVPLALVTPGGYMENFRRLTPIRRAADGTYTFAMPLAADAPSPLISCARDYGAYVRAAIEHPALGPGADICASAEYRTPAEIMRIFGEVTGLPARYVELTDEEALKRVPVEAFRQMWRFVQDFGYYGGRDLAESNKYLATPAQTWAEYVKEADWSNVPAEEGTPAWSPPSS